jgi:predicted transcriptional regulator
MAKSYIGARLDDYLIQKLDAIATSLDQPRAAVIEAAIAQYVGEQAEIGDRLERMERAIADLQEFRSQLAGLGLGNPAKR